MHEFVISVKDQRIYKETFSCYICVYRLLKTEWLGTCIFKVFVNKIFLCTLATVFHWNKFDTLFGLLWVNSSKGSYIKQWVMWIVIKHINEFCSKELPYKGEMNLYKFCSGIYFDYDARPVKMDEVSLMQIY